MEFISCVDYVPIAIQKTNLHYEMKHPEKTLESLSEAVIFKKLFEDLTIDLEKEIFFIDDLGFYDYRHLMDFLGMTFLEFGIVLYQGKFERNGKVFQIKTTSERVKKILKLKELLGNVFNLRKAFELDRFFSDYSYENINGNKAMKFKKYFISFEKKLIQKAE